MAERIGVLYAEITGDLTRLTRAIAQSDEKLKRFSKFAKGEAELTLDKDRLDAAIKEGEAKLMRLEKKRRKADFDLDVRGTEVAEVEIATVQAQLDTLRDKRVQIELDVDRSALDRVQEFLAGGILGGAAAGGLAGGGRGGGTPRGLLAFLGGTGGSGKFVSFLGGKSLPVLTGSAIAAEGALGALAAAAVALGASLAPLVGTLAAFPGLLSGLGQLGGSLFATFSGIGDAVKAQSDVTTKSVVDGTAALERERAATEAVRSAKLSLSGAQRQATDAQTALTLARKDAARTLEDMKNRAKDAALAEAGAALSLREAQSELRKVSSDPASSILDIERAQLGIKVARQAAKEARQEAQRAKGDNDRAQKGGVDKTPQVVSARKQLAEANRSVAESSRALATAQQQAAAGTDKLSSSQQKLNETMAKLSPAGRQFVRFIGSLRPAFRSIRNASQEAALPNFQKGIEGAMKNLPTFRQQLTNTSRVLGTAGKNFGKFVGGKGFGKDFQIIARANNNVMRNLGRALIPLTKAFNDIGVAAAPFTRWLGRAVLHLARMAAHSAKAGRESGGLARFLRRTRDVLELVGKSIANLVRGFGGLFKAAFPAGKGFLELLERITGKFDDWANSGKGQNSIKKFMDDQRGPLKAVGDALVSVLRLVKDLATTTGPFGAGSGLTLFARATKLLADGLDRLARIPGVGGVISNMALLAVVAGRYGKLGAFAKGVWEIAAGMRGIAAAEGASTGFRTFGLRIRGMLTSLGKTRIGETIANRITQGLWLGAGTFRKALDGFKRIMNRILGRAGIAAGVGAAEGAAEGVGASAGQFGRAGGRMGRVFGRAFAVGVLAGIALLGGLLIKKILTDWRQPIHETGRKIGEALVNGMIDAINFGSKLIDKTVGKVPGVPDIPKIKHVDLRDFDEKGPKQKVRAKTFERDGETFARDRQGRIRRVHEDEKLTAREEALARRRAKAQKGAVPSPTRSKTVEIQTPVLSLSAKTVERSMNRIQTVLRRELGEARRLIARQVENWDDVFKGFRLLRGDDPLHLGSGIRRSAEDARKALRAIVNSLGNVLERLSSLARIEGREVGSELAKGLGTSAAIRAAERLRTGVVQEFGKMKRQSGVEVQDMVSNLRATFSRLPEVVSRSTGEMLRIVLTAMKALGATGRHRISSAVDKIEGKAKGGFIKKARGGYIEGAGLYDTVPLELPAGSVIENRHQQPVIDFALRMASQLRYAMGGRVPVLAAPGERVRLPQEIPHVQRALALTAAEGLQPFGSLEQVFGTIQRPHYMAEGGQVPSATQTVARKFVGDAPAPPTITQRVVQRFKGGGKVRTLQLPARQTTTHDTDGLPGYPAHDWFAPGGTRVLSPSAGSITKFSGHGGNTGKIYGYSMYLQAKDLAYFLTHFGSRAVRVNQKVRRGQLLGTVADWLDGPPHIHEGISSGQAPAGGAGDASAASLDVALPRIRTRVKGSAGAAKELVAGAVKKVRVAANRRLAGMEGGGVGTDAGISGKGEGAPLMRDISKKRGWKFPDWWEIDRRESSHGKNLSNPSSTARLRGQFLDMNWGKYGVGSDPRKKPSMRQQIISMGRYIAERYKNPTRALAFHNAHNYYAKGGRAHFAKGGFVGRGIQSFARGGFVAGGSDAKPRGAKDPPGRRKSGKQLKQPRQPRKRIKVGRIHAEYPRGLIDQFTRLWDGELSETGPLYEDYNIAVDDASITDEVFIVDDPAKQGSQTVDWTAVRIRIAELTGLRTKAVDIESKIAAARDLALEIIKRLKATIQVQVKRIGEIYKRLTDNIARLKGLYARRIRQRKHLASERSKKGKDRDKSLINSIEDSVAHTEGLIRGLEGENVELGGLRSVLPALPKPGEEFSAPDSKIGRIWSIGQDITDNLDPSGEGVAGSLFSIQGSTGRGGRLRDIGKDIGSYSRELADLGLGGKAVTLTSGAATDGATAATDIKSFLRQMGDLFKNFGSNFRPFAKGGISRLPLALVGEEGPEFVHLPPGSRVHSNPESQRMAKQMGIPGFREGGVVQRKSPQEPESLVRAIERLEATLKKQSEAKPERPNVTQNIAFQTQPEEMHTYTRLALHELKAAI